MSFRLSICALIIGILTNSINGVPQYSRDYISPVVGSTGGSNWYTTNRETGTISEKSNKDSFTFIDSSEVRGVQPLPQPVRRSYQQQHVSFRTDDDNSNENSRMPVAMPSMNGTRSRTLHTRSGGDSKSGIGVQRDHNGVLKIVYPTRHPNQNYDVLTPGNHVRLPNDNDEDDELMEHRGKRESDIVFPEDKDTNFHDPPNTMDMIPKCKADEIICSDVDNYPEHLIENIVKEEVHRYRDFFGTDKLTQPNVTSRLGVPGDSYLCDSTEHLIFPKTGLTSQDQWKYIVNTPNFTQGIRIEKCLRPKTRCNFANVFPNGYDPVCEQKFITRQLVSITDRGKTATDQFKIPSCCNCVLKVKTMLKNFDSPTSEEN